MPTKPESQWHKWARPKAPDTRPSARERGYTTRWDKARRGYLKTHPVCVRCQAQGRITPATEVDHIIPHKKDYERMWDRANWQALCKPCHTHKTMTEDRER